MGGRQACWQTPRVKERERKAKKRRKSARVEGPSSQLEWPSLRGRACERACVTIEGGHSKIGSNANTFCWYGNSTENRVERRDCAAGREFILNFNTPTKCVQIAHCCQRQTLVSSTPPVCVCLFAMPPWEEPIDLEEVVLRFRVVHNFALGLLPLEGQLHVVVDKTPHRFA